MHGAWWSVPACRARIWTSSHGRWLPVQPERAGLGWTGTQRKAKSRTYPAEVRLNPNFATTKLSSVFLSAPFPLPIIQQVFLQHDGYLHGTVKSSLKTIRLQSVGQNTPPKDWGKTKYLTQYLNISILPLGKTVDVLIYWNNNKISL